jgi:hypothetical protein
MKTAIGSIPMLVLWFGCGVAVAQYGIGSTFQGLSITDTISVVPPDANVAAGRQYLIQVVNGEYLVLDKTGNRLLQATLNSLWTSLGGECATNPFNLDPVVLYDRLADRWIVSQRAVPLSSPASLCIAISQDANPLDGFTPYQFLTTHAVISSPKLGVWPDAYYVAYDVFDANAQFLGPEVCALQRSALLAGSQGSEKCFQLGNTYRGLLPSDFDGTIPPPTGAVNLVFGWAGSNLPVNALQVWAFHVDFNNLAHSSLTQSSVPAPPFTPACNTGPCIPQPFTGTLLDGLGDRPMFRAAYRNMGGTRESIVLNHAVQNGSLVGIRWYEFRRQAGSPLLLFQQGTFNIFNSYQWTGSAAMDRLGNIAVGYSESGPNEYPSIYMVGRLQQDPKGTMRLPIAAFPGSGSQTGISQWGNYSSLSVDPTDDCTFWYTNEYLPSMGSFNWSTGINSFKFDSCQ